MSTPLEEVRTSGTAGEVPAPPVSPRRPGRLAARSLIVALALWTAFLAAFYVLTGEHWWWRPVELAPPLTFVVVPLLLLVLTPLARGARLPLAAAALCCLLLGLPLVGLNVHALPGAGGGSAAPPGAVRVFSWNTEYWSDDGDQEAFYAYLKAQRADVYLLQEHVSWDVPGHRPVRADHVAELRARFPGFDVVAVGEMLTMSRYTIEDWRGLDNWPHLSDPAIGMPPDGRFPDYYRYKTLRTDLRIDGRVMAFYNVHVPVQLDISMDPGSAQFTDFMRAQEVRRQATYRALEQDLAKNRLPVLVAGDMNGTSAMGELRRLGGRLRDALPAGDQLNPVSWPASGPAMWRLDWAFTSESVKVHTYRMVDSLGMSDHRAQALTMTAPTG
ncbi:endonuclease/exonuclease/phosphatase family protein [Streptomyces sp. ISL-96]|uniref:endonuclease/exonuclease/phosphatase family protein n=1 Tax=Streptomyces sp. ISL-96 TaxID=2819191 RepID=UPI001BE954D3|nr:endonuclease/exonuclease/phosphatase family protein [Streptomyces sp. ISL-96]MBT2489841.1 endonuclease/exonuclease/phosphatase family protein [Streptomyces sp. ISL-96]